MSWDRRRPFPDPRPPNRWPVVVILLLVVVAAVLALASCAPTREAAKAATMADQSLAAAQQQFEQEPIPFGQGSDAVVAWCARAYGRVTTARRLLAPVVARLGVGYAPAEVDPGTTVEQAAKDPAAFDARATQQIAAAAAEVDAAGLWDRLGVIARGLLKTAAENTMGVVLGVVGGAVPAGAIIAKCIQLWRQGGALKDELAQFGAEAAGKLREVAPAALADLKREAALRQDEAGIRAAVDHRVARVKRKPRRAKHAAAAPTVRP